jgi:uracil DNA glycosylase
MTSPKFEDLPFKLKEPLRQTSWYEHFMFFFNSADYKNIFKQLKEHKELGFNFTPKLKYAFNPLLKTEYSGLKIVFIDSNTIPFLNYSDGLAFSSIEKNDSVTRKFYSYFFKELIAVPDKSKSRIITKLQDAFCEKGILFFNFNVTTEVDSVLSTHYTMWKEYVDLFFDVINSHENELLLVCFNPEINDYLIKSCPKKRVLEIKSPLRSLWKNQEWDPLELQTQMLKMHPDLSFSEIWKTCRA